MILDEFKTKIFAKIGEKTQKYIETTLEEEANTFLKDKGSHIYADGLGFDFSQMREPTVTDDSLLTFFLKG